MVRQLNAVVKFEHYFLCADSSRHRYITEEINKIEKGNITATIFSYRELCVATSNFNPENMLGEGGFGRVYSGNIEGTNQVVAVKQLDRNGFQGNREFLVEVLMLSLLSHPHLVNLVGYCADGDQRILVYEHMVNGSLEDHLLDLAPGRTALDWNTRMKIARGAAKGLEFLHEAANPPVIYRDFKASNILLDKVSMQNCQILDLQSLVRQGIRLMFPPGFGVVFLEIITGKRVTDNSRPMEEQIG
ncbi:hypothetical protein Ddye_027400 [Dipteronia dyeriana]|uniref:non-specific serine/threonine protein kinase n=1 Tax=Dipteronia dyeriana TaxID=168575 RepID=A0AAD9TP10_9ROSI|nr:hypothetical protein Ddye_027400 [Dipteronia dyeriana]